MQHSSGTCNSDVAIILCPSCSPLPKHSWILNWLLLSICRTIQSKLNSKSGDLPIERFYSSIQGYLKSASSSPLLLGGALDTARILCQSFTPKYHRQLRVKVLPKVPMWQLEQDSNQRPFGSTTTNLPMSHHAPRSWLRWLTVSLPPIFLLDFRTPQLLEEVEHTRDTRPYAEGSWEAHWRWLALLSLTAPVLKKHINYFA